MPFFCVDMWKIHHLVFHLLLCFSVSSIKTNALSSGTSLTCLCILSALSAECWRQTGRQSGGTINWFCFRGAGAKFQSEVALQTAAAPNQGDIYSREDRSLKPLGQQQLQCPNTFSFFLNSRASLALPTQPVHVAQCPHLQSFLWDLAGLFQIQPLSITEAENSGVLWEVVCSDFKSIPDSSVRKWKPLMPWPVN